MGLSPLLNYDAASLKFGQILQLSVHIGQGLVGEGSHELEFSALTSDAAGSDKIVDFTDGMASVKARYQAGAIAKANLELNRRL